MRGRGPGLLAALREAAEDLRAAWRWPASIAVAAFAGACLTPLAVSSPLRLAAMAAGLYVALSAVGLNFAVGLAGMPSLGQGAFMGVGAFAAALLRSRGGWDPWAATLAALCVSIVAGAVVGGGAVRLRGPFVAVATWVVSWLLAAALVAFPWLSGGSQGLVVPQGVVALPLAGGAFRLTPGVHFEIALVLLALAVSAYSIAARGSAGLALAAVRQGPAAASTLGLDRTGLQLGAFVASAALGGLAGALAVQLAGVADPTAYGPLLSIELFVAVVLGGEGSTLGPLVGAAALLIIPRAARLLGTVASVSSARFEPVIAAVLLLVALVLGRGGLLRQVDRLRRRLGSSPNRETGKVDAGGEASSAVLPAAETAQDRPVLEARGLSKRFGGLLALDGVDVDLRPGEVHALVGPNGSGKTTCLRILAGTVAPDSGRVSVAGRDLTDSTTRQRVEAGMVRTLPRSAVFAELTALQHVMAGSVVCRDRSGAIRTLFATPQARREGAAHRGRARAVLAAFGLEAAGDSPAARLPLGDQRLLMLATAYASGPRVMLVDEPAAGMSRTELTRLVRVLELLAGRGVALLLVEHDLRLVRALAGRVTVLDAGRMIARGSPGDVSRDPAVREAYLGPSRVL